MPEIKRVFRLDAPPEKTWEYLTNMENFASHLPGLVSYEREDERTSYWTVKIDLSMFSKEITFEVEVTEQTFPHTSFSLNPVDQPATATGRVSFSEGARGKSQIELHIKSEANGRMAPLLNRVIENALNDTCEKFIEDVKANEEF